MTISRIWHGYTTPERADEYEALLKAEVIKGIEAKNIPGLRGIDVLRRAAGDEVEFVTIMEFDSVDSVKAFVGDDFEQAYVPDEARAILTRFDERSQHYSVRDSRSYRAEQVGERVLSVAEAPVGSHAVLADGVWFVRSNNGNGSFPVTREGYRVVRNFVLGMFGWGIVGGAMAAYGAYQGPSWLVPAGPILFGVGAALSAIYFINTARKHTDYALTYNDYVKARRHA